MIKYHQVQNILPFAASILSFYFAIKYFYFGILFIIGILLTTTGLALWWLGKLTIGDAFSVIPRAKRLVLRGVYSRIRHPIYTGVSMTLLGWAIITNSIFLGVLTLLVIPSLYVRALFEERILHNHFGIKYIHYKKRTWF